VVIKTLREKLRRVQTETGSWDIRPYWDSIVEAYNNTRHESTKFAPNEINKSNSDEVFCNLYGKYAAMKPRPLEFKEGEYVLISKIKLTVFEKSTATTNWSSEVFIIDSAIQAVPKNYYHLRDGCGERIEG
jgi:hypothetical protein